MVTEILRDLGLKANHSRPWFYFDQSFYVRECVEASIAPPIGTGDLLLQHYHRSGAKRGLSPNPLFDESFYRLRYPDVARELEIGRWGSGFEHYVQIGASAGASPNWFFDAHFYQNTHHDLTEKNLRFGGFRDSYAHYLLVGIAEQRAGSWLVNAVRLLAEHFTFPNTLPSLLEFLECGEKQSSFLKIVLDYDWMNEKYEWRKSVSQSNYASFYLSNVAVRGLSPSPLFDEEFYRNSEPEVAASIANGVFCSGYEHFILHGMNEWRRPFQAFDPHYYALSNMQTTHSAPGALSPFTHFVRNRGAKRLRISRPLSEQHIPEDVGKGIYERRCALNADRLEDIKLCSRSDIPDVSLVIVVRNNFAQTVNCLLSAVHGSYLRLEVVIFDNGSEDETTRIASQNPQIKIIRSETNIGFTTAVNRAASLCVGQMILLLNNDMEIAPGAIDIAFSELNSDRSIGALGARIIRMHGRLQEAGSIVWRDGTCLGFGRDRDPLDGQANFARDVDFCSGCFLAMMRSDWEELGGFDEAYAPAYYEETDLCLRIWQHGKRVVYDPRIVVWHYEFGSSALKEEPLTLMRRNQRYFAHKHQEYLAGCYPPSIENIERARLRRVSGQRVLFIEDLLPKPNRGMGFVRSAEIAGILGNECGLVSVLGLHNSEWSKDALRAEGARRIEVLTGINILNMEEIFRNRVGVYDVVWLSRTHNLKHLRQWREAFPQFFADIKVVLDTEAIAATRLHNYLLLAGQNSDLSKLSLDELRDIDHVDHVCVVNAIDFEVTKAALSELGLDRPVSILGHSIPLHQPFPAFLETSDIVITGSFSQPDGPNADGLLWFDREVRPLITSAFGGRYVIAGYRAGQFVQSVDLQHEYTVISDPVNMGDVFRSARLMIAPTRFAGGIPMKVHEAASYGVPVLMTKLLAEQLSWESDVLGVADALPTAMAQAADNMLLDSDLWLKVQRNQAALIEADCNPGLFRDAVKKIVKEPRKA